MDSRLTTTAAHTDINMQQAPIPVSIVMCTYNGAPWVAQQLDTILAQTYPLLEIVVQDDHSTDDTWQILEQYAAKHRLIHLYRNEGERGVNGNFLSAVLRAKGELVAFSDQDDLWEPDKIARQVAALTEHDAWLVSHKSKPFSNDGHNVHYDARRPNTGLLRLCYQTEMHGHTQLFRRALLQHILPPPPLLAVTKYDVLTQLAAAAAGKVWFINAPLTHFRRHTGANTLTDMTTSKHSIHNALQQLIFCLHHYRTLKKRSRNDYKMVACFLDSLPFHNKEKDDALLMMHLQTGRGAVNFLRFQCFCLRHRHEIFYAPAHGLANALRAWFYPVLCLHYKRRYILENNKEEKKQN